MITNNVFSIIENSPISIIGVAINKEMYHAKPEDVQSEAFYYLIERYNIFLSKNQGYGFIIIDQASKGDNNIIKSFFTKIKREGIQHKIFGTKYDIRYIIENVLFIDSKESNFIQLADFAAYAIKKCVTDNKCGSLQRVLNKFDRCPENRLLGCGLKLFPKEFEEQVRKQLGVY